MEILKKLTKKHARVHYQIEVEKTQWFVATVITVQENEN